MSGKNKSKTPVKSTATKKESTSNNPAPAKRRTYTIEQKVEILKILEVNSKNYGRTQKMTGVTIKTLKSWESQYGVEVFSQSQITELSDKIDININTIRDDLLPEYYGVMKLLLQRMKERIPMTRGIDSIQKSMKTLAEIGGFLKPEEVKNSNVNNQEAQNFFLEINQHIVNKNKNIQIINHGKDSSDSDKGDSEEQPQG